MSKDQKQICLYCAAFAQDNHSLTYQHQCRKYAPAKGWPNVRENDWCLEFTERRDDWQSIGDAASTALSSIRRKMDEK